MLSKEFPVFFDKEDCPDCREKEESQKLYMNIDGTSVQCEHCGEVWDIEEDDSEDREIKNEVENKSQLESIPDEEKVANLNSFEEEKKQQESEDKEKGLTVKPVSISSEDEDERRFVNKISRKVLMVIEKALDNALYSIEDSKKQKQMEDNNSLKNPFMPHLRQYKLFELLKEKSRSFEEVKKEIEKDGKKVKDSTLKKYVIQDLSQFSAFIVIEKEGYYHLVERDQSGG